MPKERQTCTRCSMRRQKCDRKSPCSRCMKDSVEDLCTREWRNGYDSRVHRTYPKAGSKRERSESKILSQASSPGKPAMPASSFQPLHPAGQPTELASLQAMVPAMDQVQKLVDYHASCLNWFHASCLHAPSFKAELLKAANSSGNLQLHSVDLRWAALLFSIMAASIASASDTTVESWRFEHQDKLSISKQWNEAAILCLNFSDYTSRPHLCSLQAIIILGISSHLVGHSSRQYAILGTALRLAQHLGLQRLAFDSAQDIFTGDLSQLQTQTLVKREVGRRVWSSLCTGDWFAIPSTEMYFINRRQCSTEQPQRIDDETMRLIGEGTPCMIDMGRYMYRAGALLADFHDSITGLTDPAAKFEQILKFDSQLREIINSPRPWSQDSALSTPESLRWTTWAESTRKIFSAHKLIMLHRCLLGQSFSDPRFAYTRWSSISASKIIVHETETALGPERPVFWAEQAHLLGAGITLCLDFLYRSESEPEFTEHRKLVELTIKLLGRHGDSSIASSGKRLLSSMLSDGIERRNKVASRTAHQDVATRGSQVKSLKWPLEDRAVINTINEAEKEPNLPPLMCVRAYWAQCEAQMPRSSDVQDSADNNGGSGPSAYSLPQQYPSSYNISPFGASINPEGIFSDQSWADSILDYLPGHSGLEHVFLPDDMFT